MKLSALQQVVRRMFGRTPTVGPLTPGSARQLSDRDRLRLLRVAVAGHKKEIGHRTAKRISQMAEGEVADALLASGSEPKLPDEVFSHLRWGGIFVHVGGDRQRTQRLAEEFDNKRGFILERPPTDLWANTLGLRMPGLTPHGYTFTARKVELIQPGEFTERFTYHVNLAPDSSEPEGYVVSKTVPPFDDVVNRLRNKNPEAEQADVEKRAHKLVDHVFPTFLTREVAILQILERSLPNAYRHRVPRLLTKHVDNRGFVRGLTMNWLRVGGPPLSQLEFARQSAQLLNVLHEHVRVIHLDLRLDNFVITPDGVGFVDFGSAVRVGEHFDKSPMLNTLFSEMMRTSHIQRMLGRMLDNGQVTNDAMRDVHGKVDATVDSFYLAVQIHKPRGNPDLEALIDYDPNSDQAHALANLTASVLRPKDPSKAQSKTAADILRGIARIEQRLQCPSTSQTTKGSGKIADKSRQMIKAAASMF